MTVCVQPLYNNYNESQDLVEWLELNQILGATKFTIYKDNVSKQVSCVLDYYQDLGIIEVLSWDFEVIFLTYLQRKVNYTYLFKVTKMYSYVHYSLQA